MSKFILILIILIRAVFLSSYKFTNFQSNQKNFSNFLLPQIEELIYRRMIAEHGEKNI